MILRAILVFFAVFFTSCDSKSSGKIDSRPSLGVDPTWSPLNFGIQTPYVNGFVEDLLKEIADHLDIEINRLDFNMGDLIAGLDEGKVDAVLTSLHPFTFNQAKYDFSKNFLDTGPVFIVPINATYKRLSELRQQTVGVIENALSIQILSKYPDVLIRKYLSIPDLLNGLLSDEIQGALVQRVPAAAYVPDLYQDKLKIVSAPLTDQGLHMITRKGDQTDFLESFDEALSDLKRKKRIEKLFMKWSLSIN